VLYRHSTNELGLGVFHVAFSKVYSFFHIQNDLAYLLSRFELSLDFHVATC